MEKLCKMSQIGRKRPYLRLGTGLTPHRPPRPQVYGEAMVKRVLDLLAEWDPLLPRPTPVPQRLDSPTTVSRTPALGSPAWLGG